MDDRPLAELMSEGLSLKKMLDRQKQIMGVELQINLLGAKQNKEYLPEKRSAIQKRIDDRMWKWRKVKRLSKIKPNVGSIFSPSEISARLLAWKYIKRLRAMREKLKLQIEASSDEFAMKYANDPNRPSDKELSEMIVDHAHDRLADKMNIQRSNLIEMMNDAYEEMSK